MITKLLNESVEAARLCALAFAAVVLPLHDAGTTNTLSPQAILTADIVGSWTPPLDTWCTWTPDIQGGTPPYTVRWFRDGELVSPVWDYTGNTGSADFWLTLHVTDDAMQEDSRNLLVDVQNGGSC